MTTTTEPQAADRPRYDPAVDTEFPPPDLGPSVHVVGTVANVHPDETPHPGVRHDEIGEVHFDYGGNTITPDPIARTNSNLSRDKGNIFTHVLRHAAAGTINPDNTRVDEPKQMSE